MDSLNNLFEQILQTEQSSSAKITELRRLGTQIDEAQRQFQLIRNTTESLYGEYLLKTQRLADTEVDTQLWKTHYQVLKEQVNGLKENEKELKNKLEKVSTEKEKERQEFLSEASDFNKSYDLQGKGLQYREQQTRKKIALIQDEILLLETEFAEIKFQENDVRRLDGELSHLKAELDKESATQNELKKNISSLNKDIEQLEEEKKLLYGKNADDPEFKRIQQELELCRNSPEETECKILKKQLENLQCESYKKQMKFIHKRQPRSHIPSSSSSSLSGSTSVQVRDDNIPYKECQVFGTHEGEKLGELSEALGDSDWGIELDECELASLEAVENLEFEGEFDEDYQSEEVYSSNSRQRTDSKILIQQPHSRGDYSYKKMGIYSKMENHHKRDDIYTPSHNFNPNVVQNQSQSQVSNQSHAIQSYQSHIHQHNLISNQSHLPKQSHIISQSHIPKQSHIVSQSHIPKQSHIPSQSHIPKQSHISSQNHIPEHTNISSQSHIPKQSYKDLINKTVSTDQADRFSPYQLRKRPCQSIYKTSGQRAYHDSYSVLKTNKKVRFRN